MTEDTTTELGAQAPDPDAVDVGTNADGVAQLTQGGAILGAFLDAQADDTPDPDSPEFARATGLAPGRALGEFLPRQLVADLYASVSLADSWAATERARQDYPDDPDMAKRLAGQLVFYLAAQRLGIAQGDQSFEGFMSTIRQDDFIEVMSAARGKSTAS